MADREKVIQAIESEIHRAEYVESSYVDSVPVSLFTDILVLLEEQEPRVMIKSEAISYPEMKNAFSDSDKAPLYVEYKKPQPYFVKWVTADSVYLWMNDIELNLDYGKEYRFWTSRPTDEQRKAVKWND